MVNIVKTANGQYSMLNNGKLLYGTFYKIERVAESSNFYCLWPNDSLFFLYNVNLCRYALKSETTSNAQTFLRIEHYSIESKSFIAYRSDNEYAHIIFEDGAFEEKTFQYVGIEDNGIRPVKSFSDKWYFYDTTKRKGIVQTGNGIVLGKDGFLGKMFSAGVFSVYYNPQKLKVFSRINGKLIKSRDYFETINNIDGNYFIGKLYGRNIYTIIRSAKLTNPIGYFTSLPQFHKKYNLFVAMKGNIWCVIRNGKEISNYQWIDNCFFFTNEYIFYKKKESHFWRVFSYKDGQEVITRWNNITICNDKFFLEDGGNTKTEISENDIKEENLLFFKSLQWNVTKPNDAQVVGTTISGSSAIEHNENKTSTEIIGDEHFDDPQYVISTEELPDCIDYYVFAKRFNAKEHRLISNIKCNDLRGANFVAWIIPENGVFVITESRRTKVHKILYYRENVFSIKNLSEYSLYYQFNVFYPIKLVKIQNLIKLRSIEELLGDYIEREIKKIILLEDKKTRNKTITTKESMRSKKAATPISEDKNGRVIETRETLLESIAKLDKEHCVQDSKSNCSISSGTFYRRKFVSEYNYIYILLDNLLDSISVNEGKVCYQIIGEGKDTRFDQCFGANSNTLLKKSIGDETKEILLFKTLSSGNVIYQDTVRCVGYSIIPDEYSNRNLIMFRFISLSRYSNEFDEKMALWDSIHIGKPNIAVSSPNDKPNKDNSTSNKSQKTNSMNKLQALYDTRQRLKELGIEPNDDLKKQLDALEEDIIRNDIVPIIAEMVKPTLEQVKCEVVLTVEYHPQNGVHINLSRKSIN